MSKITVEAAVWGRIKVEVSTDSANEAVTTADVTDAVVSALGHTGFELDDVESWEQA